MFLLCVLDGCVPSPAADREKDADHVRGGDDQIEDDHCQEHSEDLFNVGCEEGGGKECD